ncbi:MAG TPA: hypothetical protein VJ836_02510 [Candidatus Saccharimonadales bacterium]|nr:hypothetical protein [Candidatus Saccharimonadales bacterium]
MGNIFPVCMDRLQSSLPEVYAFEKVSNTGPMEWNGPVSDVCVAVGRMIAANVLEGNYWQPARLVRAVIDNYAGAPDGRISLVNDATAVALELYAGIPNSDNFKALVSRFRHYNLDSTEIKQRHDNLTASSSIATYSYNQARALERCITEPILFLPVCHGGLVAGLQAFLYHQRERTDGCLYPIRHSTDKVEDVIPYISKRELRYIAEQSDDRTIVVYDDDACEGSTLVEVIEYLEHNLPKNRTITGRVNLDCRSSDNIARQGIYWEKREDYVEI